MYGSIATSSLDLLKEMIMMYVIKSDSPLRARSDFVQEANKNRFFTFQSY